MQQKTKMCNNLKHTIMKRYILSIMAMMTIALNASAMSFSQAQREALFLTDKMAYELNLTDEQYDACYEINLDYLMEVASVDDLYGAYWTRRNLDMSYILLDWQLQAFRAATYFYRPLYWDAGCWHFGIYARYPRRTFFYFSRPTVYVSYRGGHSWRMNGGRSYYHGHSDHFRRPADSHFGMRDRFNNRNDRINHRNNRDIRDNRDIRNDRNIRNDRVNRQSPRLDRGSSTRVTVNRGSSVPSRSSSIGNGCQRNGGSRNGGSSRSGNISHGGLRRM